MGFFKSSASSASSSKTRRIYLDYASSTPLDHGMLNTFPVLSEAALQANPSALHQEGQLAKKALRDARTLVAKTLMAHDDEIIFTSNATESDNLALHGAVLAAIAHPPTEDSTHSTKVAIITTDSEHSAVLETVKKLSANIETTILETENGLLDPRAITIAEGVTVAIVSILYVNNEIGVVQPIYDIAKRVRYLRKHHPAVTIILHVDATQAPLHYSLNVQKLGIDMMTLGATKLYCPKGVGLLYVKRGTAIQPIVYGGGQEFGLRPGTEPIQLIHDFAHALAYAQTTYEKYSEKISAIQKETELLIQKLIPHAVITAHALARTPHISHIALEGFDSELLVIELDARGFAVSAKSACKNEEVNESDIVTRIYGQGWGAVRISYGRNTTSEDTKKAILALQNILTKYSHKI
jgi:cysteine desulfurase